MQTCNLIPRPYGEIVPHTELEETDSTGATAAGDFLVAEQVRVGAIPHCDVHPCTISG